MLAPIDVLLIGIFCGLILGYAAGFLVARGIYRSKTWPY